MVETNFYEGVVLYKTKKLVGVKLYNLTDMNEYVEDREFPLDYFRTKDQNDIQEGTIFYLAEGDEEWVIAPSRTKWTENQLAKVRQEAIEKFGWFLENK